MQLEPIEVRTRDGYRGSQEPVQLLWRGQWHSVSRIVDRWYEGGMSPARLPLRYFRVETVQGERLILRHHELFDAWSLMAPRTEEAL